MTDRTCAERIAEQMEGREAHVAGLFRIINGEGSSEDYAEHDIDPATDYPEDEGSEALSELPLSIEVVRTVKVLLSTGGPADGLVIELDAEGDVSSVRYWFADWFDHADESVPTDSPLWAYAENVAEYIAASSV